MNFDCSNTLTPAVTTLTVTNDTNHERALTGFDILLNENDIWISG